MRSLSVITLVRAAAPVVSSRDVGVAEPIARDLDVVSE